VSSVTVATLALAGTGAVVALHGSSGTSGTSGTSEAAAPVTVTSASLAGTLSGPANKVTLAAFSRDGRYLATEELDTTSLADRFFIWDLSSRAHVGTLTAPKGYILAGPPVFSDDSTSVTALAIQAVKTPVSASTPVDVERWDVATGRRTTVLSETFPQTRPLAAFSTASLSRDGTTVAIEDRTSPPSTSGTPA
jgi:WD40 repeat protein